MASRIVSGKSYWFYNWASNTCIDLYGGRSTNETPIQGYQAHWDQGSNQTWRADDQGNGFFRLTNVAAGSVMDLYQGSGSDQTPINGYEWHGGDNQLWKFEQISDAGLTPSFNIVNKKTGTVVDLLNGSSANETRINGWSRTSGNGNPHQRWIAIPASSP